MSYGATNNLSIGNLVGNTSIQSASVALRNRISSIEYQNTTEVNSTVYFCRIFNNEFNYLFSIIFLFISSILNLFH